MVPVAALVLAAGFLGSARAASISAAASAATKRTHFIKNLRYNQELRICNAYAYGSALAIKLNKDVITSEPMAYKACSSFQPKLKVGDRVIFSIEDADAGTFTISDLPSGDAVLLMVIYRRDGRSTAAAFESHVFSGQSLAQVAVLDAYKGTAKAEMRIGLPPHPVVHRSAPISRAGGGNKADDVLMQTNATRVEEEEESELLRYDNVVAVDQGEYELTLKDAATGAVSQKADFVALNQESYVVVRCGVESEVGESFPQELMVYPHSDKKLLPTPPPPAATRSGAVSVASAVLAWICVVPLLA